MCEQWSLWSGLSTGSHWREAADLLCNPHLRIRFWRCATAMDHLVRNADGDELLFVHAGAGELYCDFGNLERAEPYAAATFARPHLNFAAHRPGQERSRLRTQLRIDA